MINLLPYDEREAVEKERIRRFVIVASLSVSFILAAGIVLMLPSYLKLTFERESLDRGIASEIKASGAGPTEGFKIALGDLNKKIAILDGAKKGATDVTHIIEGVLKARPAGVAINSIAYGSVSKGGSKTVLLSGQAKTRDNFLAFEKNLEDSGDFKKITSPVSNLLRDADLQFSLSLDLK